MRNQDLEKALVANMEKNILVEVYQANVNIRYLITSDQLPARASDGGTKVGLIHLRLATSNLCTRLEYVLKS